MSEKHEQLKSLCNPARLVRQLWYGNVYAARVTHEGLPKTCHLTHIQLPLSDEQLSAAVEMFGIREEDKDAFHEWLWEHIQVHVQTLLRLNQTVKSVVDVWLADMFEENGVKDIYIMTAPYKTYAETVEGKSLTVSELYGIAVKTGNLIRDIYNEGYAHGNISLGALYVSEENALVLGDFFFSAPLDAGAVPSRYKYILPAHVKEEDAVSGEVTYCADTYSLCSLLWNLANEIRADVRTPYRTPLRKAPKELSALLLSCMGDNDRPLDMFRRTISSMLRAANKDAERYSGIEFHIPPAQILYEPAPIAPAPDVGLSEDALLDALVPVRDSTAAEGESQNE